MPSGMLQKGFSGSGFILLWFPGGSLGCWRSGMVWRGGPGCTQLPELGCSAPSPLPSRCWKVPAPPGWRPCGGGLAGPCSRGGWVWRDTCWKRRDGGTPAPCGPATSPRLPVRGRQWGFRLSERDDGWIRELPPGLPRPGEVSADPPPISPFQVSFTFESL